MEKNATRMCALLVGLADVSVTAVEDRAGRPLVVHVETPSPPKACPACGGRAWIKDRPIVELVDLPAFGRATRLRWRKHRLWCPDPDCDSGSWTGHQPRVGWPRMAMTDRAGRWVTLQVGLFGRTVAEVARELGCDWHTINDTVIAYGTPLVEHPDRIGAVTALGLDETLFCRQGRWRTQRWCTSIVALNRPAQLLDVVPDRTAAGPTAWLAARDAAWCGAIRWGVMDLSGPYRKTFRDALPHVVQVVDPFHLIQLANLRLDEVRRRVQQSVFGHRGRSGEPLYTGRRLLTKAHERLDDRGNTKLGSLLEAGDPHGEVRMAWHAKEVLRSVYDIDDPEAADAFVAQLAVDLQDVSCPPEINQLGRTIGRWRNQITAWHRSKVSNGPTEAINNLIKRVKRVGFGFRRFAHYRIRVLLYAGRPDWDLLATIDPAQIR